MFNFIPRDFDFDFLSISKPFVWLSTVAIIASLIGIFTKGLNFGIEFTGGAELELRLPQDWDITKVRSEIEKLGYGEPKVVKVGDSSHNDYLVKVQAEKLDEVTGNVERMLRDANIAGQSEIRRADVVGPQAGKRLQVGALLSLFYSIVGILIYIMLRFDMRYAPGMVRSLVVDVVIVMGVWVLLQKEFTLSVVAALMTIAGYACNDTIVIYDRIREMLKLHKDWPIEKVINRSISQNLARTLLTTISTLFVVVSLWLLGGPVLADFALVMLLGFSIGVASSIFVANPMVLFMEKRRLKKLGA
ncbi:MAG: protein translocase subunit SecF [Bdellovibrionales bacterium CG10_big_fil_rev_8_21_14_0_10_45_34]|nr:MAG: protein translocase subunit SecF [Bdellovibrionales bacterium CG10_big_fil_rev_8_21_14_0_10_45_34]